MCQFNGQVTFLETTSTLSKNLTLTSEKMRIPASRFSALSRPKGQLSAGRKGRRPLEATPSGHNYNYTFAHTDLFILIRNYITPHIHTHIVQYLYKKQPLT